MGDFLKNDNSNEQIAAFYTDFSKAFEIVPLFELMKKIADLGVGGYLIEVLANYFEGRKQFVRIDTVASKTLT